MNLVERFRSGDETAFDEFYRLMHIRIFRFAFRLTGHTEDAEDVTIQTFLAVYRSRQSIQSSASVQTWMYKTAVHMAGRIRRKRRDEPMPQHEFEDANAQSHVKSVELQQLLDHLPDKLRLAFVLVKVERLTYREAAEILGRRLPTVQSQVEEASRRLRAQILCELPPVKCALTENCRP